MRGNQASKLWRGLGAIGLVLVLAGLSAPTVDGHLSNAVGDDFLIKAVVPAMLAAIGLVRSPLLTFILGGFGCGNLVLFGMDLQAQGMHPGLALTYCPLGLAMMAAAGLWGAAVESNNKKLPQSPTTPQQPTKPREVGPQAPKQPTKPKEVKPQAPKEPSAPSASNPSPSTSSPSQIPSKAQGLGAILMVVIGLVALFALGRAGWKIVAGGPEPFCGSVTPPERKHDMSLCRQRVQAYGQKQLAYRAQHSGFCSDSEGVTDLTCPYSGNYLTTVLNDDDSKIFTFCAGQVHGVTNAPAFDYAQGKVVDTPVEPPKGTWMHYRWLLDSDDPVMQQAALEEVSALSLSQAYKGVLRATALKALHRPQEALDVLNQSNPGSDDSSVVGLRVGLLVDLGKYDEALSEANRTGNEAYDAEIHYFRREDSKALATASSETPPLAYYYFIPLCHGDWGHAFEAASKWMEVGGYSNDMSEVVVLSLVLSARLEGNEAHVQSAREVMKRALFEGRRDWPFPLLRMVNGEVKEEDLEKGLDQPRLTELKTWGGLLREVNHDIKGAQADYQWVVDKGYKGYLEMRVAQQRLESLQHSK